MISIIIPTYNNSQQLKPAKADNLINKDDNR